MKLFDRYGIDTPVTLSSSYTSGGTSLSVSALPSSPSTPTATDIWHLKVKAEGANTEEVFKVTGHSGSGPYTLTVTGAQMGTSASNHASGASVVGSVIGSDTFPQGIDLLSGVAPIGTPAYTQFQATTLPASGTLDLLNYSGGQPGYVGNLWVAVQITGDTAGSQPVNLKIYYDGEVSPTINVPLQYFFASEYAGASTSIVPCWNSRYLSYNSEATGKYSMRSHIPIPFSSGIKIQLANNTAGNITVYAMVGYQTGVPNTWPRTRKLRVAQGLLTNQTVNTVITFMDQSSLSPGRMLGLFMSLDGVPNTSSPRTACLEGDLKIYTDGGGSPVMQSSGTEDIISLGWYYANITAPNVSDFNGLTFKSSDTFQFYRFYIPDPIFFSNALKVTWNCGDSTQANFTGGERVGWTIWYYTES